MAPLGGDIFHRRQGSVRYAHGKHGDAVVAPVGAIYKTSVTGNMDVGGGAFSSEIPRQGAYGLNRYQATALPVVAEHGDGGVQLIDGVARRQLRMEDEMPRSRTRRQVHRGCFCQRRRFRIDPVADNFVHAQVAYHRKPVVRVHKNGMSPGLGLRRKDTGPGMCDYLRGWADPSVCQHGIDAHQTTMVAGCKQTAAALVQLDMADRGIHSTLPVQLSQLPVLRINREGGSYPAASAGLPLRQHIKNPFLRIHIQESRILQPLNPVSHHQFPMLRVEQAYIHAVLLRLRIRADKSENPFIRAVLQNYSPRI
ncbi:hypothetical protein D3C75_800590 [compost metagenome]